MAFPLKYASDTRREPLSQRPSFPVTPCTGLAWAGLAAALDLTKRGAPAARGGREGARIPCLYSHAPPCPWGPRMTASSCKQYSEGKKRHATANRTMLTGLCRVQAVSCSVQYLSNAQLCSRHMSLPCREDILQAVHPGQGGMVVPFQILWKAV